MNIKNLLLVLSSAAALTSCSTAYKSGQTPDDVYFSPVREQQEEYVDVSRRQGRNDDRSNSGYNNYDQAYDNYRDDRFLRMSMGSPLRLSAYNDYSMYYGGLGYNAWRYNNYYSMGFNSPWSGMSYWNSFYNPYSAYDYLTPVYYGYGYGYGGGFGGGYLPGAGGVIVKSPSVNPVSRPRAFNSAAYGVPSNSYSNTSLYVDRPAAATSNSRYAPVNSAGRYNNSNSGSSVGNTMRRIMGGSNDNGYYNNGRSTTTSNGNSTNNSSAPVRSYEAPARSYSPPPASSSSGGSSSSSSGGGGGGVSRPTRGGGN